MDEVDFRTICSKAAAEAEGRGRSGSGYLWWGVSKEALLSWWFEVGADVDKAVVIGGGETRIP